MAGNSPTSPLPGVTRGGGRPAPIGSLTSVTMHSPIGSLSSVNGGVFNSGHYKATPQAQRRRWCDYTPTEVWPATPSPAGHEAACSFGVPAAGPAVTVSTSPSAALGATYSALPGHVPAQPAQQLAQLAQPAQPAQPAPHMAAAGAPAPGAIPGPLGMQPPVQMPVTGMPMPMPVAAGAAPGNLPEGTQMLLMQVPGHHPSPGFFQMPVQPGQLGQIPGAGAQMVFVAPASAAVSASAPAPAEPQPAPQEPGLVSDTNALQHAAGRQLFNEAMDPATLDGANTNLPSKGSTLHGTGRCSPCAWFWKARGCNSGFDCTYCHMCPEGELKSRKKANVQAIRMGVLEPAGKAGANAQVHNRGALKLNQLI